MPDLKTVRPPTDQEHQTLEAMTREAVGRVAMRAQMVLLSSRAAEAVRLERASRADRGADRAGRSENDRAVRE